MSTIYLSYRREDSAAMAGRLADRLAARFGREAVVKDAFHELDVVPEGAPVQAYLDGILQDCAAQLVIIGRQWLDARDEAGRRRLDNPLDVVRLEVEAALRRGIPVIPLLVHGVGVPPAEALPAGLRELVQRNGLAIRYDPDFDDDVARMLRAIERWVQPLIATGAPAAVGVATAPGSAAMSSAMAAGGAGAVRVTQRGRGRAGLMAGLVALVVVAASGIGFVAAQVRNAQVAAPATARVYPTPTPEATPAPPGNYSNPLTTGAPGWPQNPTCFPAGDGYHVSSGNGCAAPQQAQVVDADITVTVKQISGSDRQPYGVYFRLGGFGTEYYTFSLASAGAWNCARVTDDGTFHYLVPWTYSNAIRKGLNAVNTIHVHVAGNQLAFYINGTQVGAARDLSNPLHGDDVANGLYSSKGVEAVFTEYTVAALH